MGYRKVTNARSMWSDCFCERLKNIRRQRKMMQGEIAEKAGISDTAYRQYEKGRSEPGIYNAIRLAEALNVSVGYLLCVDEYVRLKKVENADAGVSATSTEG